MSKQPLDAIAVVGLSGRFPGAESVDAFWKNLCDGKESITTFSKEELLADGVAPELVNDPSYIRSRGVIESPELFDAAFFGMTPREAELTDPQQRIFLETCWHALEDAGHAAETYSGNIGVWGGMSTGMTNNTYLLSNLHGPSRNLGREDALAAMLGNENDYLTTRVSYKLNLRGPSVNVQSACSTSLVAISQAFNSLMTYGCDMALAGGVSVSYPQKDGYLHQEGDIGSPDGHCRPFDAEARGTVFSNGVGVVVLKRLEDAIEENNHIYAVVRGAALNNDGSSKVSFAAPSADGQAEVIATAQALADVDPETVSYIETHGTGTALGDPIEVAGLIKAFGDKKVERPYCALGSVKSNFGHLDSAAGVTAFIKTVLCLHHKKLVPTLHYKKSNPRFSFDQTPFYVNTQYKDWPKSDTPRRAGVSGFGIGGTNAHLVLEEYEVPVKKSALHEAASELLVFSAKTKPALNNLLEEYGDYHAKDWACESLTDIAFTLREGRECFQHRAAIVANDIAELGTHATSRDATFHVQTNKMVNSGKVIFMYPGGGAQYRKMAADLYASEPIIRETIDNGLALLKTDYGIDLASVWLGESQQNNEFLRPSLQLPAIFIVEMALSRWWQSRGINPAGLVGHSAGENAAACLAGIMSFEDCLGLVVLRGQLFETVEPSGMLSVSAGIEQTQQYLTLDKGCEFDVATINAPDTCTISGKNDDLVKLEKRLAAADIEAQTIPINIAAHSRLLDPILDSFKEYLESIKLSPPLIPIVSNLTGRWLTDEQACSAQYWVDHLRNTVLFADCAAVLLEDKEHVFLEVGPGKTLASLVRLQAPQRATTMISSLRHRDETCDDAAYLKMAIGRLWCAGVHVDWSLISPDSSQCKRVALPGYAFQRKPFLVDPTPHTHAAPVDFVSPDPLMQHVAEPYLESQLAAPPIPEFNVSAMSRKSYIQNKLTDIIEEMSGLEREDVAPQTTFLDMGFDSLFLTQANLKFKKAFGVKITFRQLFEDAPSIDALSVYIDEQLPADAFQDELQAATSSQALTASSPAAGDAHIPSAANLMDNFNQPSGSDDGAWQQALALQMQASNAIMSLLMGGAGASVTGSANEAGAATNGTPQASQTSPQKTAALKQSRTEKEVVAKGFGPYRPLDTGRGGLGDAARAELDKFIEAYSLRTAKSKALANEQRAHLADARSISGFRVDWKEAVYQIAGAGSKGSRIWDIDGNEYLDVTSGFGCNILGYSLDPVVEAIKQQVDQGFELGTLSPLASELANVICDLTGMDRVTFTNTGSEALAAAVRAARTVTGKDKIAVFLDEYHGISDELLVNLQRLKGGQTRTVPTSPGIPQYLVDNVLVLEWDDPSYMDILRENADDLAALIIEPVQNRNPALKTHLHFTDIRELTKQENIALIFDEMITGFRLHPAGAQGHFGVEADMCCYGKIVSAGMSLAVLAGRGEFLDCFDGGLWQFGDGSFPEAGVTFFGGTYTRHPLAVAGALAGLKMIQQLSLQDYERLNTASTTLANQLNEMMIASGYPARFENHGSIMNLKFNDDNPFSRLIIWYMRHHGILIYDRPFFISMAHTAADLEQFKQVVAQSIDELQQAGIVPAVTIDGYYGGNQEVAFSEAQQEVWLATLLGQNAAKAYNEQVIYKIDALLDLNALRHAMQKVVCRHEGLRSIALPDGEGLEVHPAMYVPVTSVDLRDADGHVSESALLEFYRQQVDENFDIYNGPLICLSVAQIDSHSSVLVMTAHHLVIDGWSMGVVLYDLANYYQAAVNSDRFGKAADNQLSGFNRMLLEEQDSEDQMQTEHFWLEQYQHNLPEPPVLPLDYPRPLVKSYSGHRLGRVLSPALYNAVAAHTSTHKCTLFTALFSVFTIWLNKITSQSDLVVGVPVAGQALWGCPDAVGHMVSYLPFRVQVDSSLPYETYLAGIRDYTLEANEHQRFTYGSLLKKLDLKRDPSQMPLTSVSFNVDQGMSTFDFGGATASYVMCPRNFVKYDLFFNVLDEGNGLSLEVDYNSDLFNEATINIWIDQFEQLLSSVVEKSQSRIADLTFSNKKDIAMLKDQQVNVDNKFLDTVAAFPAAFSAVAASLPDKVALLDAHNATTYAELDRKSNRFANYLIENGVNRGDYVAVVLPRNIDMVAALLAVMKAGAVYVPIAPDYPAARVNYMLDKSACSAVVSYEEYRAMLPQSKAVSIMLDSDLAAINSASLASPNITVDNQDLAYVIFTSGSTGEPKGVQITHGAMINFLRSMKAEPGFSEDDRLLAITTLSFDIAVLELYLPLLVGGSVVIADQSVLRDGQALANTIVEKKINVLQATPSTWQLLLLTGWQGAPHLKALCGGEAMPRNLVEQLLPKVGELWNMYGPTETTVWSTCKKISDAHESISIGSPIQNTTCYILDQQLAPVASGSVGELYIGGLGVAHGYLGQPELTAERFLPDPFAGDSSKMYRTGDLACRNQQGLLQHKGRIDHQVKVRGFRIELGEIEHEINKLDVVQECVVVVREDRTDEKNLVAYVKLIAGGKLDLHDLRDFLGQALPSYMLPSAVVSLDRFPLTPNEKIDRRALPPPSTKHDTVDDDSPKTEGEVYLAALWSELLADDAPIYVNDNFFDIGGHSLLAAKVCARVRKEIGVDIPVMHLITGTLGQVVKVFIDSQLDTGLSSVDSSASAVNEPKQRTMLSRLFRR